MERQVATLSRKEIIEQSLNDFGAILLCNTREEAVQLANDIAPEHLEVLMENPMELLGALIMPVLYFWDSMLLNRLEITMLDQITFFQLAVQHVSSPHLGASFVKRSSYTYYTRDALRAAKDDIMLIANREGLTAHANAIAVRFEDEQ